MHNKEVVIYFQRPTPSYIRAMYIVMISFFVLGIIGYFLLLTPPPLEENKKSIEDVKSWQQIFLSLPGLG